MAESEPSVAFRLVGLTGWSQTQLAFSRQSISAASDAFAHRFGMLFPASIGHVSSNGETHALRVAPDRIWMVSERASRVDPLGGDVGAWASSMSLTDGQRRYRLSGSRLGEVLAKGIALDLDSPGLAPGRAARTQLHRVPILLHRLAASSIILHLPRSFAESIEEWLADAQAGLG